VQSLTTGQVVTAGTVETRRGTFYAYGQRLEIERGRLLFDGPIDNPGLDIAAWRRNQAVEAGVEVKGPLRTPLIRVVTNPPVPESEQLAWLVLGRPAESGAQADYAALQVAAAALLRSTSGTSQPSVAQMVGLDEIGFRSAGATGGQAVALGKRLGDRLYATYEQSIDVALAVFRLEFALTRRIALRAETGSRSGMDVFYRYSFD
jgi:translocation and assembly module TamB